MSAALVQKPYPPAPPPPPTRAKDLNARLALSCLLLGTGKKYEIKYLFGVGGHGTGSLKVESNEKLGGSGRGQ